MPKNTQIIGLKPIKVVVQDETSFRVSLQATKLIQSHLISYATKIAQDAVVASQHSGRTTILSKDIILSTP